MHSTIGGAVERRPSDDGARTVGLEESVDLRFVKFLIAIQQRGGEENPKDIGGRFRLRCPRRNQSAQEALRDLRLCHRGASKDEPTQLVVLGMRGQESSSCCCDSYAIISNACVVNFGLPILRVEFDGRRSRTVSTAHADGVAPA